MKKLIVYGAFLFASATALVACDNKGGDSAPVIVPPACVSPNYVNPSNICVGPNGTVNQNVSYIDSTSGSYNGGSMSIVDSATYRDFLKTAMAVCDRYSSTNNGNADCSSFISGGLQVSLQVSSITTNVATLQFSVQQRNAGYYYVFGAQTPLAMQNPMYLPNSPLSVINNYAGFDVSRNVNLNLVQLVVRNGKLGDATINYELTYSSQKTPRALVFARGTLTRTSY